MRTRLLVLVLAAAAAVALTPGVAGAHADLVGSDPAPSAVLDESPGAIELEFNEAVEANLGAVRLFDSRGRRLDVGPPQRPGGASDRVRATVPDLDDGTYVVTWRVVSADGHPIRGAYTFQVGASALTGREAESLAARLLTEQGGSTAVGVLLAASRGFAFGGTALLVGAAWFLAVIWRDGRAVRGAGRIVWAGWWLLLGATLAGFALQGPYVAGLGLVDALDPSVWSEVWDTRFGQVWLVRAVVLLALVPLVRTLLVRRGPLVEHPLPSWWAPAAAVGAVALCAAPGLAGHAVSGRWIPLAIVGDVAHVGAMSVWLGGLAVLGLAVLPRADHPTLVDAVPRFSQTALASVVVLVVSGTVQGVRQVGAWSGLVDTDYGRLLLAKIGVFLVLVVVAAAGRDVVNRRWRIDREEAELGDGTGDASTPPAPGGSAVEPDRGPLAVAEPGGGPLAVAEPDGAPLAVAEPGGGVATAVADQLPEGYVLDEEVARRRLRRTVSVEYGFAVVILAITALLVNAPPPREANSGPFFATIADGDVTIDIAMTPARTGPNDLHLYALTPGGGPQDVLEMTAELTQPARDIAPIDVSLIRVAPGHYTSSNFTVPFPGDWELVVKALVTDVDQARVTTTVPVRG